MSKPPFEDSRLRRGFELQKMVGSKKDPPYESKRETHHKWWATKKHLIPRQWRRGSFAIAAISAPSYIGP